MVSRGWMVSALVLFAIVLGLAGRILYVNVLTGLQAGVWANQYITRCVQMKRCPALEELFPAQGK